MLMIEILAYRLHDTKPEHETANTDQHRQPDDNQDLCFHISTSYSLARAPMLLAESRK